MSGFIPFSNASIAELEFHSLDGSQGLGFYRLLARFQAKFPGSKPPGGTITLHDLVGELQVRPKEYSSSRPPHYSICRMRPISNVTITTRPDATTYWLDFEAELDARRIQAIEDFRDGGDIDFQFALFGQASQADRFECWQQVLYFQKNQSAWIKTLSGMGFKNLMLLEFPLYSDATLSVFADATKHLKTAQDHYQAGRYDDAVGYCRKVLEAIVTVLGESGTVNSQNKKAMSKADRIRWIRETFIQLTHMAMHHDPTTAQVVWTRNDAKGVLSIAGALLHMVTSEAKQTP